MRGLQVSEPNLKKAMKEVHTLVRLRLEACEQALIQRRAPEKTDWEPAHQLLATEAAAICQVCI